MSDVHVRIAIRWRDIDTLGHLNQAVYHEFLEEGRTALFEERGLMGNFNFVLARVELDYRSEVRRDHGTVDVVSRVATVGRSSIGVDHEVVLPDGTVAAQGRSVLVAWDPQVRRARQLTDDERAGLQEVSAQAR